MGPLTRYPTAGQNGRAEDHWQRACRAWVACRAWACLGRVAQSLLAASQPGESHDVQRASPANTRLDKYRESEAHWTPPDILPHISTPKAVRAKSVQTCNASQKLFLASWPSKTRRQVLSQPCNNTTGPDAGSSTASLCHYALLLAPGYALLLLGSFRAVSTCRSTITDLSHPISP